MLDLELVRAQFPALASGYVFLGAGAEPLLAFLRTRRGVRIHGDPSADRARRVPTISFTVDGAAPEEIVRAVDAHDIGIRHGSFSRDTVRALGLPPTGVIRASMAHYNTSAEIGRLVTALDAAIANTPTPTSVTRQPSEYQSGM